MWIGKEAQEEEKTEAMASGKNICRSCAGLRSRRGKGVEKWEDCSMIFHARLIGKTSQSYSLTQERYQWPL